MTNATIEQRAQIHLSVEAQKLALFDSLVGRAQKLLDEVNHNLVAQQCTWDDLNDLVIQAKNTK